MEYTISINFSSSDNQNFTANATYDGTQSETVDYTFSLPRDNVFSAWHECSNSGCFCDCSYNYNDLIYTIIPHSTYLSDATRSCPNYLLITGNNINYNTNLYSYTSTCNSANAYNSFTGNYLGSVVTMTYDISTNVVSNFNCNTNISSATVSPGQKNTTYNFYSNSNVLLAIQCSSNYSDSGVWTLQNINVTNYAANNTQMIVAISFLCNMYYSLSYFNYSNQKNNSALNSCLVLVNGLSPIIQIFNDNL